MHSRANFIAEHNFEKTLGEYQRVRIFILLLSAGIILGLINLLLDVITLKTFFKYNSSITAILLWMFFFLNYEVIFYFLLKRYIKSKRAIPDYLKTLHSLVEILFPGVIIFMLINIEHRQVFLDSPFFFFYFILIAISALQLDFKISLAMGFFGAIQYALLTYYAYEIIMPTSDMKANAPSSIYYMRSVIMVFTGLAAGLVAREINKRIQATFAQISEKQKIINLFGQQVSKEIVDELIKRKDNLDIRRVEATIMFLDIRNFSTYAETKDPAEIIEFQNNIFNPLIEIISKHHGIVNQFLGDGFMASFGIPLSSDKHVQNAYNAGLEIINKINELGIKGVIPRTRVGIGLHCGEVITGNIGNDIRKQYSIAGTTVITSARLEQLNKQFQTQFLITRNVLEKINIDGQITESLGETAVKGFEKPVEVICVKV